ncbi:hypothetical protein CAPTEDRAFT_149240 [Capitella teleta]|uniref:procollagen-proline 4-dioxygenase n=1 Tax=Capitella teleta TaxID=283909 RepID=R7ULI1_CAPTE|nr:hypothetical protein CAPTEDRAFT_149240 [Capitella teleta]|eukprot:ELU04127.1 hypothetical protein CAPTEDRAFT_149240 [Capitella teleta]
MEVLFLLLLCVLSASADQFTALVELEQALRVEGELAKHLEAYINLEEARLAQLRQLATEMDEHSRTVLSDPVKYLGNPVNAFLVVKRFTVDWPDAKQRLIHSRNTDDLDALQASMTSSFPSEDDYVGSIEALIRLQDTYALETHRIAEGKIPGVKVSPKMSAFDCFEMGRVMYNEGDQYHTILWMQEALDQLAQEESKSVEEESVLDYLSYALYVQGNLRHARNITQRLLDLVPEHTRAQNNLNHYNQLIAKEEQEEGVRKKGDDGALKDAIMNDRFLNEEDQYRASPEFQTYEALCRGEDVVPVKDPHKLTCQYRFWHPMFYINPLREETASLEPWIAVYHQLMNDHEIERIKEMATPRLARATVHNSATGQLEHAKYRISKSGWLRDEEDPLIARISERCSALTNLSLTTVEELQVVNYGIGGQYEPHFDFSRRSEPTAFEKWRGNRILTVIYYMTDVEAGGATVFLDAGVKVYPEKGSAAVWHNLLPSGEGDMRTRHAACPVLTGSKWVANKWFHERDQEFRRPCELEK